MFAAALAAALGMGVNASDISSMTSASCVAMSFILSLASLGQFSDPTLIIPVFNESGLVVQLQNLTCPMLSLGAVGVHYSSTDMHVWLQESLDVDCYLGIGIHNETGSLSISTDLHFAVQASKGQEIHITARPVPSSPCLAENATLANMTLRPVITELKLVPDEGSNWLVDTFVLPLVQKALTEGIHNMIMNLSVALVSEFNNNTVTPQTPAPVLHPGATPLDEWSVALAAHNIVNNLPSIGGLHLLAEFATETTLRINISLPSGIYLGEPTDATFFNIPPGFQLSLEVAFDYLICGDAKLDCIAANGIRVMNMRLTGAGELDRLVDNAFGPLLESLINGLIAGGAAEDGSFTINIPNDGQVVNPPLWVTLALGPILSIAASCCIAYSAYRHIVRPVLDSNGEKVSFLRIFFEDSIVTATCFGCIYLFIWSNTTSAASVIVGDAIPVYNFALLNTVEDLWKSGLKALSVLVFIFSGVYPYFKMLTVVTFSVILQRPQSRILRVVDNLGKLSLLDTFVMTILKAGLEINGLANVNAHPSFYVFVTATVLSILVGNYATHGWRRETTVWMVEKHELLIQDDDSEELSKQLSKVEQERAIDALTTEAYVERLSAMVRRKKAEEQEATRRRNSPGITPQNSTTRRVRGGEDKNLLGVLDINAGRNVHSPTSGSSQAGPTPTLTENYGTTSSASLSSDLPQGALNQLSVIPANSRSTSGEDADLMPASNNVNEGVGTTADSRADPLSQYQQQRHPSDSFRVKSVLNTCLVRSCFVVPNDEELTSADVKSTLLDALLSWEWYLALPLGAIVLIACILSVVFDVLRYNISGIALLVVPAHKSLTMADMFLNCDAYLLAVGLWSVMIAPVLYVVTFPHCRSLAAWCATDAFLLACVAGLLQLQYFIAFILGASMQPVYSATCSLLWPLILLFVGMLIQWFFIFKQMLNIEGVPTLRKIKASYNSPSGH